MKKNVGLTYGDFEFPAEQGFTGSRAKGYKRGGAVKKMAGGFMGPEREIAVDDVTVTVPRAKGGAVHNKLVKHGAKMGFAYGGRVKDTSGEFKAKRGKQKTMDHGVQPARRGKNARNQAQAEAGGTGRLLPGLHKGGKVKGIAKGVATSGGGALADAAIRHAKKALRGKKKMAKPKTYKQLKELKGTMSDGDRKHMDRIAGGLKSSKKGMPKNVKMAGGMVHKARGGSVKK